MVQLTATSGHCPRCESKLLMAFSQSHWLGPAILSKYIEFNGKKTYTLLQENWIPYGIDQRQEREAWILFPPCKEDMQVALLYILNKTHDTLCMEMSLGDKRYLDKLNTQTMMQLQVLQTMICLVPSAHNIKTTQDRSPPVYQ